MGCAVTPNEKDMDIYWGKQEGKFTAAPHVEVMLQLCCSPFELLHFHGSAHLSEPPYTSLL